MQNGRIKDLILVDIQVICNDEHTIVEEEVQLVHKLKLQKKEKKIRKLL